MCVYKISLEPIISLLLLPQLKSHCMVVYHLYSGLEHDSYSG